MFEIWKIRIETVENMFLQFISYPQMKQRGQERLLLINLNIK